MKIKIQSYSDIITNSSSELFKVHTSHSAKFIEGILEDMLKIYNKLDNTSFELKDVLGISESRGDIVIYSVRDNSIPWMIREFIENTLHGDREYLG